jgi:hypothetical protein
MLIHLAPYEHRFPLLRQLPDSAAGKWKNCTFFEKHIVPGADWLVVYDNPDGKIKTHLPRERRMLITAEPPEILHAYPKEYLDQFGVIVTFRSDITAPRVIKSHCALPWFAGLRRQPGTIFDLESDGSIYDKVINADFGKCKTRLCSVVVSNKRYVPGHERRLEFVQRLKQALGDEFDVFGDGVRPIADKLDAIVPYKYHIVFENSQNKDYWTEKLADSYLGEAFPIYWGCPNITDYFSEAAISVLDLNEMNAAVAQTVKFLEQDDYAKRVPALKVGKSLLMEKYNLFTLICDVINNLDQKPFRRSVIPQTITPWRILHGKKPGAISWKSRLKKLMGAQ